MVYEINVAYAILVLFYSVYHTISCVYFLSVCMFKRVYVCESECERASLHVLRLYECMGLCVCASVCVSCSQVCVFVRACVRTYVCTCLHTACASTCISESMTSCIHSSVQMSVKLAGFT